MADSVYNVIELRLRDGPGLLGTSSSEPRLPPHRSRSAISVSPSIRSRCYDRERQGLGVPRQGEGVIQVRGRRLIAPPASGVIVKQHTTITNHDRRTVRRCSKVQPLVYQFPERDSRFVGSLVTGTITNHEPVGEKRTRGLFTDPDVQGTRSVEKERAVAGAALGRERAGHNSTTRRAIMPKYLFRASLSPEGVAGVLAEGGTARRTTVRKAIETLGGTLDAFYFTFGDDDVLGICELPDNETAAAFALEISASAESRYRRPCSSPPRRSTGPARRRAVGGRRGPDGPFTRTDAFVRRSATESQVSAAPFHGIDEPASYPNRGRAS